MFNKFSVTILNKKWEVLFKNVKLSRVPTPGELIYINDKYHRVVNIINTINKKIQIHIIIEKIGDIKKN